MATKKKTEKVSDRLKNQPPYEDEKGEVTDEKPEEEVKEEVKAEPKVEGAEDKEEVKTTEEELPKDAKERTKEQFDKLKESNKKLKEENEKAKAEARKYAKEGLVSSLVPDEPKQPQPAQQPQYNWDRMVTKQVPPSSLYPDMSKKDVKNVFDSLVDDQGYVDSGLLKETLESTNTQIARQKQENERLRQQLNQTNRKMDDFQRSQTAREVHDKHPQLNPDSDQFNPKYFEATRDKMVANLAKGLPEDFMGSADSLAEVYVKKETKEEKESKKKKDAIAQINATGTEGSSGRRDFGDHEELVKAVQYGKKGALAERLKRSGY